MTPDYVKRYARHLMLKEVGGPGQTALSQARIAIVGAGGLGGPAGLYLAAAGAGHITLIDDDAVEVSNLQRQIQFGSKDIGAQKTEAMAAQVQNINPNVSVTEHALRLSKNNASALLQRHDIILDGTDSFEARFAVAAAAQALKIPLMSGAIGRFDGQVSLFLPGIHQPCYRCLVPEAPEGARSCAEVGVIGALAGIIGSVMALETIKHITGAGKTLAGRLWIYDGLHAESRTVTLPRDPSCPYHDD